MSANNNGRVCIVRVCCVTRLRSLPLAVRSTAQCKMAAVALTFAARAACSRFSLLHSTPTLRIRHPLPPSVVTQSQSLSVFRRVHYRLLSCNKTGFSLTRFLLDQSEMFNIIKFKVTHNIYNEAPIVAGTNAICSSIFKRFFSLSLSLALHGSLRSVYGASMCVCVCI